MLGMRGLLLHLSLTLIAVDRIVSNAVKNKWSIRFGDDDIPRSPSNPRRNGPVNFTPGSQSYLRRRVRPSASGHTQSSRRPTQLRPYSAGIPFTSARCPQSKPIQFRRDHSKRVACFPAFPHHLHHFRCRYGSGGRGGCNTARC
jgi:hypothetical protein